MIRANDYYNYIYKNFILKNEVLLNKCEYKSKLISKPLPQNLFFDLWKLLDVIYNKYEFNMHKMCLPNYNHFILWHKNFNIYSNTNELMIAIEFIVFCCLADKILDSSRFNENEKKNVCKKLNIDNFLMNKPYKSEMFEEMDMLLNDIRVFIHSASFSNSLYSSMIIEKIKKAFISEIYMYENPLLPYERFKSSNIDLLIDKSIKFEEAAFLLASVSTYSETAIKAAQCIGNIFWLSDDLCDFIQDIKCRRKNSALFYCAKNKEELFLSDRVEIAFKNIDIFISLLEQNILELKEYVNVELYSYILYEVSDWFSDIKNYAK